MGNFSELLKSTLKPRDVEENIDIYFTRPCGLVLTLFYKALNIHPNIVTIIGILIGVWAGYFFSREDICANIIAIVLVIVSNLHDSADGQLARITGKKTLIGRMLDGFSGDVFFFAIYVGIVVRLFSQPIPLLSSIPALEGITWQWWGFVYCCFVGFIVHSPQATLADYYRQIHLFFLKGEEGSELSTSEAQTPIVEDASKNKRWLEWAFFYCYRNYCRGQEKRTPEFQRFYKAYQAAIISGNAGIAGVSEKPGEPGIAGEPEIAGNTGKPGTSGNTEASLQILREDFLAGSRPLMKWCNFLTFNWRAITISASCLANVAWLYPLLELTVFNIVRFHMQSTHESLSRRMYEKLKA